jgi:glycosyltransferase involved in cell wall biosynthesis
MKVSVVIPAYEVQDHLQRAVTSVFAAGYPDLEVVIVDDGSRDGTLAVARRLSTKEGRIRVLQHPAAGHRGAGASRNLGIMASTGEIIAFLDGDDWYFENRFAVSLPILRDRPDVDGVYESARIELEDGGSWFGGAERRFGILEPLEGTALLSKLLSGQPWPTTAFTCRRGFLDRTGLFPEHLHIAEDCHLWFRMACLGRLVAGKAEAPVSAYYRHAANTYHPALDRKLDMVKVMADVWNWSRGVKMATDRRTALLTGVRDYIWNGVVACRKQDRDALAWELLGAARRFGGWRLLAERRFWRQGVAMICR